MATHQKWGDPVSATRRRQIKRRIKAAAAVVGLREVSVVDRSVHHQLVGRVHAAVHSIAAAHARPGALFEVGSVVLGAGHCPSGICWGSSNLVVLGYRQAVVLRLPAVGQAAVGRHIHSAVVSGPNLICARAEREPVLVRVHKTGSATTVPVATQGKVGPTVV